MLVSGGQTKTIKVFSLSSLKSLENLYLCAPQPVILRVKSLINRTSPEEAQQVFCLCRSASRVKLKSVFKMPKVKTNSSAKKRFKVTGTGKITHQKAFKRHILTKKSTKRKRHMRQDGVVSSANLHFVKRLLRLK